jgi:hypothetical protein
MFGATYSIYSHLPSISEALPKTHNLTSVLNFPTCTLQSFPIASDNIFTDIAKMGNYSICFYQESQKT